MRLIHFNSNIIINLFEPRWSRESTFIARKVIKACNLKRSGVSIMLSNDRQIQKLNHKWKGKNTPTNVLSFPCHEELSKSKLNKCYLGDIILAYETLKKEALDSNILFLDHMSHLLIHGILHLKGYTHENKNNERIMQIEEIRILKNLNINNPYKNKRLA